MEMREQFVSLSTGVRMEYVEQGPADGVPVVFLHGVTDSWRSFEHVLPLLPQSVHAYAISAWGHGGSSRPDRGYLLSDRSTDLRAFMDAMGLERPIIVGHSMGSMVAQRFVVDHPDRAPDRSHRRGLRARVAAEHARATHANGPLRDRRDRNVEGTCPRLARGIRGLSPHPGLLRRRITCNRADSDRMG